MGQPGTLRERRTLETRQLILDAAYTVFARRGYGGAAVDEIVAEAGLSKGAFYHHFPSKEAVFQALLAARARRCTEAMAAAIVTGSSVADNVRSVLRAGWKIVTDDPMWANIQMEFWVQATREDWARQAMSDSLRQCRQFLADAFTAAQERGTVRAQFDPEAAARLVIALSDGVVVQWQIQPDEVDPHDLIEPMAEMITSYLTCPAS
ncbi:MAG TPA: TetR/AcrR family transcriptional regulator [Candidatus Krumholzibacteria bacterium]